MWLAIAFAIFTFLVLPAQAVEGVYCVDEEGYKVAIVVDDTIEWPAIATIDDSGYPIIVFNESVVETYSIAYQKYLFLHECAHHSLGHTGVGNPTLQYRRQAEIDADCWALVEGIKTSILSIDEVRQVIYESEYGSIGSEVHKIGPAVAEDMRFCMNLYFTN